MKITKICLLGLLASGCYAGGDKMIVEESAIVIPEVITDDSAFYLGLGVSGMSLRDDFTDEEFSATGVMLQAGYKFNNYFALEGRYTVSVSDVEYEQGSTTNPHYDAYPTDFSNMGIYLKSMYPIGDFTPYILLGYGEVELTNIPLINSADRAESGFQWGLGAGYNITENIIASLDYVRLYDDVGFDYRAINEDVVSDLWTLSVSYKF